MTPYKQGIAWANVFYLIIYKAIYFPWKPLSNGLVINWSRRCNNSLKTRNPVDHILVQTLHSDHIMQRSLVYALSPFIEDFIHWGGINYISAELFLEYSGMKGLTVLIHASNPFIFPLQCVYVFFVLSLAPLSSSGACLVYIQHPLNLIGI